MDIKQAVKRKRGVYFITVAILAAVNVVCAASVILGGLEMKEIGAGEKLSAGLTVSVTDSETGEAVSGATVAVPESDGVYYGTGEDGKTAPIKLSVTRRAEFDNSVPQTWGEATLIVYKDGYIDYVLNYLKIIPDSTRAVNVTLYKNPHGEQAITHQLVESPDREWAEALLKRYKK